jgi:hypothetical protein
MAAGIKDIFIEQGASFRMFLTWTEPSPRNPDGTVQTDPDTGLPVPGDPYDLTGAEAHMQIRQRVGSTVLMDLRSGDGNEIVLGGVAGTIAVSMTPEQTANIMAKRAKYDLYVIFPDRTDAAKVLKGKVTVDLAVTREVDPLPIGGTEPVYEP